MHSEHLRNVQISWVAFGWFIGLAVAATVAPSSRGRGVLALGRHGRDDRAGPRHGVRLVRRRVHRGIQGGGRPDPARGRHGPVHVRGLVRPQPGVRGNDDGNQRLGVSSGAAAWQPGSWCRSWPRSPAAGSDTATHPSAWTERTDGSRGKPVPPRAPSSGLRSRRSPRTARSPPACRPNGRPSGGMRPRPRRRIPRSACGAVR